MKRTFTLHYIMLTVSTLVIILTMYIFTLQNNKAALKDPEVQTGGDLCDFYCMNCLDEDYCFFEDD